MTDTLYEVRSYARSNDELYQWDGYYTREEAETSLTRQTTGARAEWAEKYHRDWHIREIDVRGMFEIPEPTLPRKRFVVASDRVSNGPGHWDYRDCQVFDLHPSHGGKSEIIAEYTYHYAGKPPFEPFRQGGHFYALMAESYTGTSVLDLQTGEVIAAEPVASNGFCPVGFYVPDWWDVHDGSIKPGGAYWRDELEEPSGKYGFVWGCVWGDDSSWKVQYLDLSQITEGKILRDDRFGYVELATITDNPKDFINIWGEADRVEFAVTERFNLTTGKRVGDPDD